MPPATLGNLNSVISTVLSSLLSLVGAAFIIMLIYSGYMYLQAGSSKEALQKAKSSLVYSLLGLVLALSAWIILSLVGTFLGANFSSFDICIVAGC